MYLTGKPVACLFFFLLWLSFFDFLGLEKPAGHTGLLLAGVPLCPMAVTAAPPL
jgi:hypothetical protein